MRSRSFDKTGKREIGRKSDTWEGRLVLGIGRMLANLKQVGTEQVLRLQLKRNATAGDKISANLLKTQGGIPSGQQLEFGSLARREEISAEVRSGAPEGQGSETPEVNGNESDGYWKLEEKKTLNSSAEK